MIKALIFDLDGVLVSTKKIHFEALNMALQRHGVIPQITYEEHLRKFDGLSTDVKLEKLGLSGLLARLVWDSKQEFTEVMYQDFDVRQDLVEMFKTFKSQYKLAVATNSIERTTRLILERIGILPYLDVILTNEQVHNPKPSSEIYLRTMIALGCEPKECLIFEDSPKGLQSAHASGGNICTINSPDDLTLTRVTDAISTHDHGTKIPWVDPDLTVLIPMAGQGSRFERAGYSFPKPLIDVNGKTMIQAVVESLGIKAKYVYLVQKAHSEKYHLKTLLNLITPNCQVIEVDGLTEGSACTTLLAKELIDNDNPLLIANSDQIVDWNSIEFIYRLNNKAADAGILTFPSSHVKWSYADVDEDGRVKSVAEKIPISSHATVGIYWYKKGSDYVKFAEQMIAKNIRVNNEFYICPIFNEFVAAEKTILIHEIAASAMHGTGTPEDLDNYLQYLRENAKRD